MQWNQDDEKQTFSSMYTENGVKTHTIHNTLTCTQHTMSPIGQGDMMTDPSNKGIGHSIPDTTV